MYAGESKHDGANQVAWLEVLVQVVVWISPADADQEKLTKEPSGSCALRPRVTSSPPLAEERLCQVLPIWGMTLARGVVPAWRARVPECQPPFGSQTDT